MNSQVINLDLPILHKTCATCNEVKHISKFKKTSSSKDDAIFNQEPKRHASCKVCTNAAWRLKNAALKITDPEKHAKNLEYKRKYHRSIKNYNAYYLRKYGITFAEVEQMYKDQLGKCANRGCGKTLLLSSDKAWDADRACVDHNHDTNAVRGLLCRPCNTILGTIESQENIVLGLLEYGYKNSPAKDNRLFELTRNILNKEN